MSRAVMQQALQALEGWDNHDKWVWPESAFEQAKRNTKEAITALRAALAEPEQEPVAYCTLEQLAALKLTVPSSDKIALYTAPTPRKPLTDEEIAQAMFRAHAIVTGPTQFRFAKEIERAHGIGEQHEH